MTESDNRERVARGQTMEREVKQKRRRRLAGVESRKGRRRLREGRWKKRLI